MIEEKITNDIEFYKKEIERMNFIIYILENKKIHTKEFEDYKLRYFSMLNDNIPKKLGRGSERFRELRKNKINEVENIKKEFNEYFNI